ncbi:outer membrane beta-barrel protein [Hymenobacter armeniacus]|uniref:TonB-dependent receptor n=1 Tax=Hymenobacter armeniacus TaxID=2771358 RepID=A0ABR8JLG3_9BACT|nr:outer membrane beta-barrel protein [Hymenobacter armeniacus]MBD2720840.1 TonB-dependent receptor [Hymenobacter armeniacus]
MKTFFTASALSLPGRVLRGAALVSLLLPLGAAAQTGGPGSVSGSLLEDGSGKPVPFSDVVLLRSADSTFVTAAQTTEQGAFRAAGLPLGTYLMRVQDLNYKALRRRFTLTEAAPAAQFPGLKMTAATATKLSEVVVTAQKATVVEELGKRVINVEKDLGSVGGTAANVLQNVPSVSVDVNGTVSMRGTSNVTILIDGKPAGVSNGGAGGQRLDQIPASRIAQVEVITNPSAKYDAAGGGGVINLITKKETRNGTNGTAALNLGTADKYSGNLNLSRKQGKATWQAGYDGRDVTYGSKGHSEQMALLGPETVRTTQVAAGNEIHRNHSLRAGVDLQLPKDQTLSLSVNAGTERNIEGESQELTQQTNNGPVQRARGRQDLDVQVKVLNFGSNYRRTWAEHKGRELSANFGGVVIDANVPVVQRQYVEAGSGGAPQPGTRQLLELLANIQFAQVDYTRPLADGKGRLEMGAKVEHQGNRGANKFGYAASESRPNDFVDDPNRSLDYTSDQLVPAAYVTYQRPLGAKWSAQAGLRSEYTILSGSIRGGVGIQQRGSLAQDYLNFFPSATINREFGKEPGQNRLQLSYARRLNRPNFMQQLPLAIYQDPRSYRLGNPRLRAEFSHNIELGHQLNLGQATITSTVFARITTNSIQRLRFVDTMATRLAGPGAGLVTAETYDNLGTTTNLGAEFSLNQPLAKWWRLNASTSLYRAQIAGNGIGNNRTALVGTARLTNNFTLRPTLDVQLSGNVRSASLTAQGRQLAWGQMDIALRQRLFSDRAALTLRVSDVLNTSSYRTEIETNALTSTRYAKDETRVGWLGFTWYIGASKAKPGRIEAAPQGGGGFGG